MFSLFCRLHGSPTNRQSKPSHCKIQSGADTLPYRKLSQQIQIYRKIASQMSASGLMSYVVNTEIRTLINLGDSPEVKGAGKTKYMSETTN